MLLPLKGKVLIIVNVFVSSAAQTAEQAIDKSTKPMCLHMENYWQGNARHVRFGFVFYFYVLYSLYVNLVRFKKQFLISFTLLLIIIFFP